MIELKEIEIKYIESLIPCILFKKFSKLNISKIEEILSISVDTFQKNSYIGKSVVKQFVDLCELINNEPEKIYRLYNLNRSKILPINYSEDTNLIILFKIIIEDFLKIIETYNYKTVSAQKRQLRNIDIIRKYYGINSQKYDRYKIAKRYRINIERVRQIIVLDFIPEIKNLINGIYLEDWKCECRKEVIELIQSYKKDLAGTSVLSEFKLSEWLKDYGNDINDELKNYFIILLNAWGYEQLPLSRYYLLRNNVFYADERVDKNLFLKIGTKIVNYLRKNVIPVSFDDIMIEVLDEYDVEDDFIRMVCEIIDEIEKNDKEEFQIKFEYFTSVNDYVYRLLYEKRKELSYNELLHLINKRLVHFNKEISMESLKSSLKKDDHIIPVGKTGIWTLKDSNTNVESQVNLILKSLRTIDEPLTVAEITRNINENFLRKDITARSISSNLRNYKKYFIKLKGDRFALAETIDIYNTEIAKTRKPNKKKGILKKDEIATKAINILQNNSANKMQFKDLIRVLTQTNQNYTKMDVYRAINENPLIFKKENTSSKNKYVILIVNSNNTHNDLTTKYKWNELKKILERELSLIFNSNIQPTYSITLSDALESFYKIIVSDVSMNCPQLSDIADRILPTLYKFYVGASDRNDKLNFLKQIVTSQESYFKKLLFYIDNPVYNTIKSSQKGFGNVLDKLIKLDPRKNRYLDIKSASNFEFGKHCSRAYSNRNMDTHNANSWTEAEIIETKISCLVFMVYAAFEYNNEIKKI